MAVSQASSPEQTLNLSSPNNQTPQPVKNNLKITLLAGAVIISLILVVMAGFSWYMQGGDTQSTPGNTTAGDISSQTANNNNQNSDNIPKAQNSQSQNTNSNIINQIMGIFGYNQNTEDSGTAIKQNASAQNGDFILSDGVVQLPLPINDTRVFRAAISYSFIGDFLEFRNSPPTKEIVLKGEGGLPKFNVVEDRTRFYWWDDSKKMSAYAKESDLKPGNKVRINTFYSLKQKLWTTHQVFIYIDAIPAGAIPTAITE